VQRLRIAILRLSQFFGSAQCSLVGMTALTFVFDTKGRLRLLLRHDQTVAQCASDIRLLLKSIT
jgi:hypothetical protein